MLLLFLTLLLLLLLLLLLPLLLPCFCFCFCCCFCFCFCFCFCCCCCCCFCSGQVLKIRGVRQVLVALMEETAYPSGYKGPVTVPALKSTSCENTIDWYMRHGYSLLSQALSQSGQGGVAHVEYMLRCLHVVVSSALVVFVEPRMYPTYSAVAHQYMAVKAKSPYFGEGTCTYATMMGVLASPWENLMFGPIPLVKEVCRLDLSR